MKNVGLKSEFYRKLKHEDPYVSEFFGKLLEFEDRFGKDLYEFNAKEIQAFVDRSFGGHGSKSVFLLQNFITLTPEEAVAINCHMGAWENEHVGSSWEQYPLGFLLHVADGAATYILEGTKDG